MWVEVASDGAMASHAAARGMVRMIDGRIARLVRWPTHRTTVTRGRYARLESTSGGRFTVPVHKIESLWREEP